MKYKDLWFSNSHLVQYTDNFLPCGIIAFLVLQGLVLSTESRRAKNDPWKAISPNFAGTMGYRKD